VRPPGAAGDARLAALLHAADDHSARRELGDLLARHAAPLVQAIVRAKLGAQFQDGEDAEDVQAGVLLRLAERLRALRAGDGLAPPEDFTAYVAVTAHNACHAFLRRRHPERARLRNKLRYLLTHHADLALWSTGGRDAVCGLRAWSGRAASEGAAARLAELRGRVGPFAQGDPAQPGASPLAFVELVLRLVRRAGEPLAFDALAAALEEMLGLTSRPLAAAARSEDALPFSPETAVPDPGPTPEQALQQRRSLERLWREVCELPPRQRAALLLNLRDADGRGMLGLFPLVGLATVEQVADVLGWPRARFAALWPELPRDDEWIAAELGVTRRQVINFRKCARERLARRLRAAGER
jgi:DNA-directed RNA polymerase specialized sigma24 family protein